MCWSCNISKLKAQKAEKDINVYKVVMKATKSLVYLHLWNMLITKKICSLH